MFKYIIYIIINKNDTDICLQEDNEQVIYIFKCISYFIEKINEHFRLLKADLLER